MDRNRPRARQKNVTSGGKGVNRRGSGLGTGPVGSPNGYSGKSGKSVGKRAAAGGGGLSLVAIIVFLASRFLGGGGGEGGGVPLPDVGNILNSGSSSSSSLGYSASGESKVNTSVAAGSRDKRTEILGNNQDKVTIMVYMCGTDLESKNGMASSDLQEMAAAKFGDNVNLIIYTGGCNGWKISGISNKVNQIYQLKDGNLKVLESDMGTASMTSPSTLSSFIKYCKENFPANRNNLIFWDHGGGSVSGFGYDEKNKSSGSMSLAGIDRALSDAGMTFDFIGFDACLMATAETALMLDSYADYMIASEETEPGIGWYYTDWLTALGKNTSLSTLETGKNIVDDFVETCAKKCRGQKTTLSVIDLAEFSNTVPKNLNAFSKSVSSLLSAKEYETVSDARYNTREFATSSKIDQVDLVNLAENVGTSEGKKLAEALKGAVKYNRTSSNMTNAYGVSIYFPYQRTSQVDSACSTYSQIGMDSEYSKCIRQFASLETSGQIAAGGTSSPVSSILGSFVSGGSGGSSDIIGSLLSGFLGGDRSISGLDDSNTSYMSENALSQDETAEYISLNYFDANNLVWTENGNEYTMVLPETQWDLVHKLDKNVFYDDGSGYIDLGLDNVYSFDGDGNLIADTDRTWIAINGQPVAYYHTDTVENGDDYSINGYVPVMLNDERAKLLLVFDNENPYGFIAGAVTDYTEGQTDTVAKSMTELAVGDKLDFVCDYYTYEGEYLDSYYLGEQMTVTEDMEISNVDVGDGEIKITYCFTDMYNQEYWTEAIVK